MAQFDSDYSGEDGASLYFQGMSRVTICVSLTSSRILLMDWDNRVRTCA